MTGDAADLIAYRLQRARETWQEASELAANGHWHGVANRLYYACFYAATAWLVTQGLSAARHTGVRALVNRHLIQPGLLTREAGRLYNDLFELRQESDYEDFVTQTEEEVGPLVPEAAALISNLARLIEGRHSPPEI